VPFYPEMLLAVQEEIHAALMEEKSPKQALDDLAKRHKEIIEREGYPDKYPPEQRFPPGLKTPADVIRAGEPMSEVGKPKK